MASPSAKNVRTEDRGPTPLPPAKRKLADAMRRLLRTKDFNSITTAEISRTAEANEALIYRYFKDKRGLLHQVLYDYLLDFHMEIQGEIQAVPSALDKLRCLVRAHIRMYDSNRVFAKILLLEVRNFPAYFESSTYRLVKGYGKMVSRIIADGVQSGEIRDDIPVPRIRDLILGGIEHFCMAAVIFGHEISVALAADNLSDLLFKGFEKN